MGIFHTMQKASNMNNVGKHLKTVPDQTFHQHWMGNSPKWLGLSHAKMKYMQPTNKWWLNRVFLDTSGNENNDAFGGEIHA